MPTAMENSRWGSENGKQYKEVISQMARSMLLQFSHPSLTRLVPRTQPCHEEHHEDLCHDTMAASSANWKGINNEKVHQGAAPAREKPTLPVLLFSEPSKAEIGLAGFKFSQLQSARTQYEVAVDVRSSLRKFLMVSAKADNSVTPNHAAR